MNGEGLMMKSTGFVKRVDEFGRIVIPAELRRTLDIDSKGSVEFFVDGKHVMLRKYVSGCSQCGRSGTVFELGHIKLCAACRDFCTGFAVGCFIGERRDSGIAGFTNKMWRENSQCHHK